MKLRQYLKSRQITTIAFAKRAGLSQATISKLANGQVMPSRTSAQQIAKATDNQVMANDFFHDDNEAA